MSLSPTSVVHARWQRFRQGDYQAYAWLYDHFFSDLYNYGYQLSERQEELVEDGIHDLFVTLWKQRTQLGEVHYVKSYLFACLRRNLIRSMNRQRRREAIEARTIRDHFQVSQCRETRLVEEQTEQEQIQRLRTLINQLPDQQREVLFLRYYEDLSCPEIAELLAIKVTSAYTLLSRALKSLKAHVHQEKLWYVLMMTTVLSYLLHP